MRRKDRGTGLSPHSSLLTPHSSLLTIYGGGVSNGRTDGGPAAEAALDVLERFGQELQYAEQASQQIRLILSSVRKALGADAVFWHPGATGDAPEGAGADDLPLAWRQDFMGRVLAEPATAQGQLLASFLDPGAKPVSPWPCSRPRSPQQVARQLADGPELPPAPAVRAGGPQGDAAGPAAAAQPPPAGPGLRETQGFAVRPGPLPHGRHRR